MLVLKNVNVFDGVCGELIKNAAIVIDGDVIKEIIPHCNSQFENDNVVDLEGKVVTPGFIDCHVHFMLDEIPDKERQMNDQSAGGVLFKNADSYVAFRAVENARKTLEAGFTTVVDGGGVDYVDVAFRDALRLGYVKGPDYYISGKQITAWTSHFRGLGQETYGPWGMRRMVREQLYYGVDQIKIENSAPIRSVGRSLEKSAFTSEEMKAAVDEAHSAGLLVSVHARGARPVEVAAEAGADLICHGTGISEKGIEMILERGDVYKRQSQRRLPGSDYSPKYYHGYIWSGGGSIYWRPIYGRRVSRDSPLYWNERLCIFCRAEKQLCDA